MKSLCIYVAMHCFEGNANIHLVINSFGTLFNDKRLRFGEFLADNIVRFINLFTYLLTYLQDFFPDISLTIP